MFNRSRRIKVCSDLLRVAAVKTANCCRVHGKLSQAGDSHACYLARVLHCYSVSESKSRQGKFAGGCTNTARRAHKGLQETMKKAGNKMSRRIANFLTLAANAQRRTDALLPSVSFRAGIRVYGILLVGASILAIVATAQADGWHLNEDIARVAEEFVVDHYGRTDPRVTPQAGYLDPRLQLPLCDVDLDAFLRPGTKITSRTAVGVRCSGSRPWKIYVPVDVVVTEAVLVARKMLPRGHILTAADVRPENRNVARLIGGYIADPAQLVGQRLKHQIMGGKIVTPSTVIVAIPEYRRLTPIL